MTFNVLHSYNTKKRKVKTLNHSFSLSVPSYFVRILLSFLFLQTRKAYLDKILESAKPAALSFDNTKRILGAKVRSSVLRGRGPVWMLTHWRYPPQAPSFLAHRCFWKSLFFYKINVLKSFARAVCAALLSLMFVLPIKR